MFHQFLGMKFRLNMCFLQKQNGPHDERGPPKVSQKAASKSLRPAGRKNVLQNWMKKKGWFVACFVAKRPLPPLLRVVFLESNMRDSIRKFEGSEWVSAIAARGIVVRPPKDGHLWRYLKFVVFRDAVQQSTISHDVRIQCHS